MIFSYKSLAASSLFCCALLILGLTGVAIASTDGTERWVQTRDEGWCLIAGVRTVCLPTDYAPESFKNGFAEFRSQLTESSRPLVDYESSDSRTLSAQVDSIVESGAWVVGNTQYHDLLTIVEVSSSNSQPEKAHGETHYILDFGGQFTLKIYGRSREENESLARAILAQWKKESRHG